jgi:hypothetical protein
LQKLLNTATHIQARAVELENALRELREQERCRAIKNVLSALRNSPAGDLVRVPPDWQGENGPDGSVRGMLEALMEAFPIKPVRRIGDKLVIENAEVPHGVDLDRPIGDCGDSWVGVEIISVGWTYNGKVLLKPIGRPLFSCEASRTLPDSNDNCAPDCGLPRLPTGEDHHPRPERR